MSIKKSLLAAMLFFVSICSQPLMADVENSLEFRVAAFFHSSKLFRHIYGNSSACYQVEANVKIAEGFSFWTNVDWFSKHGHSIGLRNGTRVNIVNVGVGVKYFFKNCSCVLPYVGLGMCVGSIWVRNHSQFVDDASKAVVGGVAKAGLYYPLNKYVFLDAFVDYNYQPVHFSRHHCVDIGGVKTGLGIGTHF
jgi:hypothetical protein